MNWMLLGAGLTWFVASLVGFIVEDIRRGQAGYDSVYYRQYVPSTSPMSFAEGIAQVRNLPIGQRAWVRSGAGCEYLVEHAYEGAPWFYHLAKVHETRSRWGFPCHEASWWCQGTIIADGGPDECLGGRWRAWREEEGGGIVLRWQCVEQGGNR